MGRKIFYVEHIEMFENSELLWHYSDSPEEREKMWALSDKLRSLIDNPNVGLTDIQRECILWYLDGLTFTEMGNRLNVSHTWAKSHVSKGIEKIKSFIKNQE